MVLKNSAFEYERKEEVSTVPIRRAGVCTLSMSFSLLTEFERESRVKGRRKEAEAEKGLLAVGDPS